MAQHTAYRVVTDLSARALHCAQLTAALNGVGVDARLGSGFRPVEGECFDLLVCNPPFVITPRGSGEESLQYRDAGSVGDGWVLGRFDHRGRGFPDAGGLAIFLGNWEVGPGQGWPERVSDWLDRTGLDALVIQRDEQDPGEYAETWADDAGLRPGMRHTGGRMLIGLLISPRAMCSGWGSAR
ncbi:hypothetical protein BH23ACT6_BH23ACT6_10940 [soil metagenome]